MFLILEKYLFLCCQVSELLEAGASPNIPDAAGWFPLHEAAGAAREQAAAIVGLLVSCNKATTYTSSPSSNYSSSSTSPGVARCAGGRGGLGGRRDAPARRGDGGERRGGGGAPQGRRQHRLVPGGSTGSSARVVLNRVAQ